MIPFSLLGMFGMVWQMAMVVEGRSETRKYTPGGRSVGIYWGDGEESVIRI